MAHRKIPLSRFHRCTQPVWGAVMACLVCSGIARTAGAQATPVMMQWFEANFDAIEYRMPDFFIAGYGAVWLPPISRASDATSPGYDVFDRFDLGTPGNKTLYGTAEGFAAVVDQFHRAGALVYLDGILNHNSGRNGSSSFYNEGGYPGFWLGPGPAPLNSGSNWGDFHNGATQSHDPGGGNYNLWLGDLVSLIDIAQESNHQYIRQPASASPPPGGVNIPAGTLRNQPNPANVQYYPDRQLASTIVNNPGQSRPACCGFADASNGSVNVTLYPYNSDALQGDPAMENATGLLMRWTQWMLDVYKVDGFRWDASKHIPPWFWDQYIDSVLYQRRTAPDGSKVTPYTFGENVMANDQIWNFYIRKGNLKPNYSFGNRDALDLAGSGALRDMINQRGFFSWNSVLGAHLDNADDFDNNGSIGVNHVYSHDNGSAGNGSAQPALPAADKAGWPEFAYLLLRTGFPKVYHNARQFNSRSPGSFWPREGSPEALGLGRTLTGTDPTITNLVRLHNRYARGAWDVKVLEGDVICFERHSGGLANVVCCASDTYNNGFDQRTFVTRYPQGTRLVELTGNATDPIVDPNSDIFDTVTVGAGGSVTIRVPRNRNANAVEHNRGYVVYGQVTPPGTFSISSGLTQVIPPDDTATIPARRRLNPIDVVQGNSFTIQLLTQNDPVEGALDDSAIYRFGQGFFGANAGTNGTASGEPGGEFSGYENFVTTNSPRIGGTGTYQQVVSTSTLPEGMNYLSVVAFRQRAPGTSPIYSEWRDAIYIDRVDPVLTVDPFSVSCATGGATVTIRNPDRTASRVYFILDLPPADPLPPLGGANQALQLDRTQHLISFTNLTSGTHTYTLVSQEIVGSTVVRTSRSAPVPFNVTRLVGDFNNDNAVNTSDLTIMLGFFGTNVGPGNIPDLNGDGLINTVDLTLMLGSFGAVCN